MNIFSQYYEWHPKYVIQPIDNKYISLLADFDHNIISVDSLEKLNDVLQYKRTLDELSAELSTPQVLLLYNELEYLLKAGYIRQYKSDNSNMSYHTPGFDKSLSKILLNQQSDKIIILSEYEFLSPLLKVIERIKPTYSGSFVIVDDFFDPRLHEINTSFRDEKEDWILVKVTGEQAFVGPLFKAGDNTACWQCLHHRMRINTAIRWVTSSDNMMVKLAQTGPGKYLLGKDHSGNRLSGAITAVPIQYTRQVVDKHIELVEPSLQKLVDDEPANCFFEVNAGGPEPRVHPVIPWPQCPCCGDPYLSQRQQPIKLQQALKLPTQDGGVRCNTPEETCRSLSSLISPISGLLSHIKTASHSGKYVNKIFRSGFFQIPQPLNWRTLSNDSFHYTTMGKGISAQQSKASALSEGIERLASQYQGNEFSFYRTPRKGDEEYILPQDLTPFSQRQYERFEDDKNIENQLYAAARYKGDSPLHWTEVWSLTQKRKRFVPLSYCYANTPYDDQIFCRFYHNGGAAGNRVEEAILQGFLEIVERDAVAIWWYNKIQRTQVDITNVSADLLRQLSNTLGSEWEYWAINITNDFNIPVIAAISQHRITGKFCFGFGCHVNATIACQRALTELCQITEIRDSNTAPFNFDAMKSDQYLLPNASSPCQLEDFSTPSNQDISDDIQYCLAQAERLNLDVLALDYSRPEMILNTVKIIIPGTCHIFPYLAAKRLYQVPVSMGFLSEPKTEEQLNAQALLI